MPTRFRLSTAGDQHHLMIDSTPAPENVAPARGLARMDGFALSLVLDRDDVRRLRSAVQGEEVAVLKAQLSDMTNSYKQAKAAKDTAKLYEQEAQTTRKTLADKLVVKESEHRSRERASAVTIGNLAKEIASLKEELRRERDSNRAANHEREMYQRELASEKNRYAQLYDKHQVLSSGYQRVIDQGAKFLATSSPRFSFDPIMSSELNRLRKDLKTAQDQRDAARADAECSKSSYDKLLALWEKTK